jgi:hypothetical protein
MAAGALFLVSLLLLSSLRTHGCDVRLSCNIGSAGLGDQLEHYVYCLNAAKLLNATYHVDSWPAGQLTFLKGGEEYEQVAQLLGILGRAAPPPPAAALTRNVMNWPELSDLALALQNGSHAPLCDVEVVTSIVSCFRGDFSHDWCDFYPTYDALDNVIWGMREADARNACHERGLGFSQGRSAHLNVVWHVRTGDVCTHCSSVSYYTQLHARLAKAAGKPLRLFFESQHDVAFLRAEPTFANAEFSHKHSMLESTCLFLTADVLVTSGSSLPIFISAFAPPWHPIVIEESRKEVNFHWVGDERQFTHFYKDSEAVRMWNGVIPLSDEELAGVFSSVLAAATDAQVLSADKPASAVKNAAVCYVASQSPDALPLQVFHNFREERLGLLQLYAPYVAGQVYLEVNLSEEVLPPEQLNASKVYDIVPCAIDHRFYHPCVGQIAHQLANGGYSPHNGSSCSSPVPVSGIVVHHADMWVNPTRLLRNVSMSLSQPWLPEKGVSVTRCLLGAELQADTSVGWWENSKVLGLSALAAMPADQLPPGWPPGRLCYGHADLFYVPASLLARWGKWARAFSLVMHECAVPTMTYMSAALLGMESPLATECEGGCCAFLGNPDLRASKCAHRIDLEMPALQEQMRQVLGSG